jgi:hypothetical protein
LPSSSSRLLQPRSSETSRHPAVIRSFDKSTIQSNSKNSRASAGPHAAGGAVLFSQFQVLGGCLLLYLDTAPPRGMPTCSGVLLYDSRTVRTLLRRHFLRLLEREQHSENTHCHMGPKHRSWSAANPNQDPTSTSATWPPRPFNSRSA